MTYSGGTPAGWYADPGGAFGMMRYWDGASWTDHTSAAAPPQQQYQAYANPHVYAGHGGAGYTVGPTVAPSSRGAWTAVGLAIAWIAAAQAAVATFAPKFQLEPQWGWVIGLVFGQFVMFVATWHLATERRQWFSSGRGWLCVALTIGMQAGVVGIISSNETRLGVRLTGFSPFALVFWWAAYRSGSRGKRRR